MQLSDFFMLFFEHSNTHGLAMILVHLLPASLILDTLIHLCNQYRPVKSKPMANRYQGLDTRTLHQYHNAVRDFDLEVEAWEQAAYQVGRRL